LKTTFFLFCVLILDENNNGGKNGCKKSKLLPFLTDTNLVRKTVGIFQQFPPFFLWSGKRLENQILNKWLQKCRFFQLKKMVGKKRLLKRAFVVVTLPLTG